MNNIEYKDLAKALYKIKKYSNVDAYQYSSIISVFDDLAEKKNEKDFNYDKWQDLLIEHKVLDKNGEI